MKKGQPEPSEDRSNGKAKSGRKPDALREQVEKLHSKKSTPMPLQDAQKVLHELEVHQIELEMQNEALRHAQDTIVASQERYVDLYDFAPIGYFTFDRMGLISEVNLTGASLLGIERGQLSKKPFSLFVAASSRDTFQIHYRDVLRTGTPGTCELQLTRRGGTGFYALVQSVPVRDAEGNPTSVRSAIADVTERKQAEKTQRLLAAVQEEKDRLSALVNSMQDEVWFADTKKRFTLVNPSAVQEFGLGAIDVEKLAKSLEVYRPDGSPRPVDEAPPLRALQGQVVKNQEEMIRTPVSGELRYRQVSSAPVRDRSGTIIGSVSVVRDITEQKRVEEKIRAALKEKEVLLKEIHHRVKNNLQIISSLLFMQASKTEHAGAISALKESRARVRSMALIHERLYASPDLASVDMGEYTGKLVSNLQHSYSTEDSLVRLTLNIVDIPLGITEAIPCGLIINELVSNALKHAFPKGKEGEITIQLRRTGTTQITLTMSDNGIGFPEHVDFRKSPSLGLTLVNALVEQLEGTIELDRSRGTAFTITFG